MKISVSTLRRTANLLLSHLEENGITEIEVDEDFYWDVSAEQLYKPNEKPIDITLGQLSDNVVELEQLASGASPPVASDLLPLAAVLRFVGAKVLA